MTRTIAVIAAHPDDEVLGCGATIAKHVAAGDAVHILILAEGETSRSEVRDTFADQNAIAVLRSAAMNAAQILGANSVEFAGFPDNRLDRLELLDVVKRVEQFLDAFSPDVVYTHSPGDMNFDHTIAHRAVATAMRPIPEKKFSTLLQFEVLSSTEWGPIVSGHSFLPNWFEDVSAYMSVKLKALEAYAVEMRKFPHPRSLDNVMALAMLRGATVGVNAAEAFVVGLQVNRGDIW